VRFASESAIPMHILPMDCRGFSLPHISLRARPSVIEMGLGHRLSCKLGHRQNVATGNPTVLRKVPGPSRLNLSPEDIASATSRKAEGSNKAADTHGQRKPSTSWRHMSRRGVEKAKPFSLHGNQDEWRTRQKARDKTPSQFRLQASRTRTRIARPSTSFHLTSLSPKGLRLGWFERSLETAVFD
jgi:hypothetical protein